MNDDIPVSPQDLTSGDPEYLRVQASATNLVHDLPSHLPKWLQPPSQSSTHHLEISSAEPNLLASAHQEKTEPVFYLAYGSNLSAETFRGRRGIQPISQLNVCVPSLKLTFDLPGLPYAEPCFANTALRDPDADYDIISSTTSASLNGTASSVGDKTPLLSNDSTTSSPTSPDSRYNKDNWHKPLVGVLYELTPEDFARVIATEGGGASYTDIVVACYELPESSENVPMHPDTTPILAHTLFAPTAEPSHDPPEVDNGRSSRPDPSYAQASMRYLKLIHDGAIEHSLPQEYRDYLATIRPYRTTTHQQRLGAYIFSAIWMPIIMILFGIQRMVADDKGRSPKWMQRLTGAVFSSVWWSYDGCFKKIFGDGERTIGE